MKEIVHHEPSTTYTKLNYTKRITPSDLYELAEIHKTGAPLRPIVSNIQSPQYNTAKLLANILTQNLGKQTTM